MNNYQVTDEQVQAIQDLQQTVHESCVAAGWYTDLKTGGKLDRNFGEMLALMHSEISEALEGWRKNLQDDHLPHRRMVEVELADLAIRLFDTSHYIGIDLGGAIQEKFAYNQTRADHKIENRMKENGKKI